MDMPGMRDSDMVAFQGAEHQRPLIAAGGGRGWGGMMWEPRALWSGMWGMGMAVGAQGIHERRTESFRRRDRDTVGANPQLIPFSLTPPKLPDSSLLSRSRSG